MKTLVVTGGAGFIGSNFTRLALAATDFRVVVFDKLTYAGSLESLRDVADHARFAFVRGDIARRDDVASLFREHQPVALINFAAESHVDRSIERPDAFLETNVVGAFELLEAARRFVAQKKGGAQNFCFVHVSTDEVYGSLGSEGRFHEGSAYAPNSPYAASKAAADHLVRAYHKTYGLDTRITNCSNNYGPYQFPEKLIPLMILNAMEGKALPIYGDGANVRDWIFVEDHCAGLLQVLEQGSAGECYNLGGNAERTNLEVVESICELLDEMLPATANEALRSRGKKQHRELLSFVADRPGHDRRYAVDSAKIEADLGWRPRHDFAAGLRATVRWYLDHQDWCQAVQRAETRARQGLLE